LLQFPQSAQTDRAGVVCFTSELCGLYRVAGANAMIRQPETDFDGTLQKGW